MNQPRSVALALTEAEAESIYRVLLRERETLLGHIPYARTPAHAEACKQMAIEAHGLMRRIARGLPQDSTALLMETA